ncbi:MAG: bifunctional folylpolyglutamate synthase/dihydrofolate synthase [Spirochaetales bacterium]|nr:bifunctional folylpolyglutamate synthase/dihydrofolate synthase [Spirochaetales bacterium]
MSLNFNNAVEVFEYIQSFYNLEQTGIYDDRTYRLDRISFLLKKLDNPHLDVNAIHIAGSKGKGSTARFTAEILKQAGYKVGLFTSPHLYDYRERITLAGDFFPEASYVKAGEILRLAIKEIEAEMVPTVFELLTAMFFVMMQLHNCRLAVIETGLGGRLDATNICKPIATIITSIELEHTEYLGNTIEEIATEKAGIIKDGVALFTQAQGKALKVIKKRAAECNSQLFSINRRTNIGKKANNGRRSILLYDGEELMIKLEVSGKIQLLNFLTAASLCRYLAKEKDLKISNLAIGKAAEEVNLHGRCEILSHKPLLIIDGSHTEKSIKHLFQTIREDFPSRKFITIFGCASEKNYKKMLRIIHRHSRKIIITRPGTFKKSNPEEIYEKYRKRYGKRLILETSPLKALELCKKDLKKNEEIGIIVTGSFYLANEIKGWEKILK